jgi:hypothetical protein
MFCGALRKEKSLNVVPFVTALLAGEEFLHSLAFTGIGPASGKSTSAFIAKIKTVF